MRDPFHCLIWLREKYPQRKCIQAGRHHAFDCQIWGPVSDVLLPICCKQQSFSNHLSLAFNRPAPWFVLGNFWVVSFRTSSFEFTHLLELKSLQNCSASRKTYSLTFRALESRLAETQCEAKGLTKEKRSEDAKHYLVNQIGKNKSKSQTNTLKPDVVYQVVKRSGGPLIAERSHSDWPRFCGFCGWSCGQGILPPLYSSAASSLVHWAGEIQKHVLQNNIVFWGTGW